MPNNKDYKKKKNYHGKKNSGRDEKPNNPKDKEVESKDVSIESLNDPDWYAPSVEVAKAIASIPFNIIPGTDTFYRKGLNANLFEDGQRIFPSVMTLRYRPVPGVSTSATSGINMAARQLYSYIRRANSGARNYEAPDLMMYILAMESIYVNYIECARAMRAASAFTYENRAYPSLILYAMGFQATDLRRNLADYRARLNIIGQKVNSLAVPSYFKSFKRRAAIANNLFVDADSIRAGAYLFVSSGYWVYDPLQTESGGGLNWKSFGKTTDTSKAIMSMSARLDTLEEQIQAVITDDDMNTMMGDIIKAFGESGLYKLALVQEGDVLKPAIDTNIIAQIENSRICALDGTTYPSSDHRYDITQANNVLYYRQKGVINGSNGPELAFGKQNVPFNSHKNNPDYADVLEWSRCINVLDNDAYVHCGLELFENYNIYRWSSTGIDTADGVRITTFTSYLQLAPTGENLVAWGNTLSALTELNQFDWRPNLAVAYKTTESAQYWTQLGVSFDIKVFTYIAQATMNSIHDCANYSLYYSDHLMR